MQAESAEGSAKEIVDEAEDRVEDAAAQCQPEAHCDHAARGPL